MFDNVQCRLQLYDIMTAHLRNFLCFPLCITRDASRKKGQGGRLTKGGTLTVAYFCLGGNSARFPKFLGHYSQISAFFFEEAKVKKMGVFGKIIT